MSVTTKLVETTELAFLGSAHATANHFEVRQKEASQLWDNFSEGPVRAFRHDMDMRKKGGIE